MSNGTFITFEGIEGGGKSTHVPWLVKYLEGKGHKVLPIREPGGTTIGEEIRQCLKHSTTEVPMCYQAEILLMNASRAQLVREKIRPALERGEVVIADRFYDSTTAYQGYGRKIDPRFVTQVIDFAVGYTRPDLTFLIDITLEQSELNMAERYKLLSMKRDRIEASEREFFERVYNGFQEIAKLEPERVRVIPYHHNDLPAMQEDMLRHLRKLNL